MSTYDHTHTFTGTQVWPSTTIDQMLITPPKEPSMAAQVAKERTDRRERARVKRIYSRLDEFKLDEAEAGQVIAFYVGRDDDVTWFAATCTKPGVWSVTDGPRGVALEDLFAWMIDRDVDPNDISVW